MDEDISACYGRQFGKLDRCEVCQERAWCAEAADPKAMTGPHAGPTGDDAAYETVAAQAVAVEPMGESADRQPSPAELLAAIVIAANFTTDRIAEVSLRLLGLSYAEIGVLCSKSKQAVAKDVAAIEQQQTALGRLMRKPWPVRMPMARALVDAMWERAKSDHRCFRGMPVRMRKAVIVAAYHVEIARGETRLTREGGICDRLAKRLGLTTWEAAYKLLVRSGVSTNDTE